MYQHIASILKLALPSGIYRFLRRLAAALLTPLIFAIHKGHFRSALVGLPLARDGEPIPWLTYPAIDFLRNRNLKGLRVLEFGAGHSTLWFSSRGALVTSLETDTDWYKRILLWHPKGRLYLVDPDFEKLPAAVRDAKYQIILIDGGNRLKASRIALELLNEKGIIIHDNSEQENIPGHSEIPDILFRKGFSRIDLYGFSPEEIREQCTSIYWKNNEFFLSPVPPNRIGLSGPAFPR